VPVMAWQNSGAMVGNGGGPGSNADGNHVAQTQGTEYTLQGMIQCSILVNFFTLYCFFVSRQLSCVLRCNALFTD